MEVESLAQQVSQIEDEVRQTGADGFRFDAVKHFPAYVVEDLLYNAMGNRIDYFAVGEYVDGQQALDAWADGTRNRAGTLDFALRKALSEIVEAGGFFDMGSLPNHQQKNRLANEYQRKQAVLQRENSRKNLPSRVSRGSLPDLGLGPKESTSTRIVRNL